ncbi:GAF domain-containing protein [Geomonas sp. Red875]|uniref:GAF domain-containing protein n=2 Tax=Geomesophilobacter sediminis TaxID=2798584 RepID=A0A8J7J5F4_9BACT|nr:GAF domain-containing protein [Geomesophilobacter sediminis]
MQPSTCRDAQQDQFVKLVGLANFLEQQQSLDQCLSELLDQAAAIIKCRTCSIMLFRDDQSGGEFTLRIFAKHGDLPASASQEAVKVKEGIAGHVAATGQPLLVQDIGSSPFLPKARRPDAPDKGFLCVPIIIAEKVIGVLNVSTPEDGRLLSGDDLNLASFIAILTGKSIQVIQLQNLLRSRYAQMAIAREGDQVLKEAAAHDPERLSKMLAKSFYREMAHAGFGSDHIVGAATEILSQLNDNLSKHKTRIHRDA